MDKSRNLLVVAILLLVTGALLFLSFNTSWQRPRELLNATVLPEPRPISPFALYDHEGAPFNGDNLQGRFSLMFFGFTHCPDVCPLTLQKLAAARAGLKQAGANSLPDILFVSVDPERDTQEILAAYVAHFGEGVIGLRGDSDSIQRFTRDLGIFYQRENGPADSYQVSHSAAVLLINPDGELRALFSAPQQLPALLNDLPIVMNTE